MTALARLCLESDYSRSWALTTWAGNRAVAHDTGSAALIDRELYRAHVSASYSSTSKVPANAFIGQKFTF